MKNIFLKRSGMARVNEGSHSLTCDPRLSTRGMNHSCLYSPAADASLYFARYRYSFSAPMTVNG